jgi:hypothetical protein
LSEAEPTIHDLRVTIAWSETFIDLLADPAPTGAPLAGLGRRDTFAKLHEEARSGELPGGLASPWPRPRGQMFWTYYCEKRLPADVTGLQSWRWLVPLRATLPAPQAPAGVRANAEAFFHPHGTTLVVTFSLRRDLPLFAAVAAAMELRREALLVDAGGPVTVDRWAQGAMLQLRQRVLGSPAAATSLLGEPLTVTTVVDASGVDLDASPGEPVHRAVDAWAGWSPTWKNNALPNLEARTIPTRQAPPSHLLYGSRRGRTVWFPARFGETKPKPTKSKPTLSCYHRNLVLASLQVDSLLGLVANAIALQDDGVTGSAALNACHARAAEVLGRLHAGRGDTYRTRSVQVQIDQDPRRASLETARARLGMSELAEAQ